MLTITGGISIQKLSSSKSTSTYRKGNDLKTHGGHGLAVPLSFFVFVLK